MLTIFTIRVYACVYGVTENIVEIHKYMGSVVVDKEYSCAKMLVGRSLWITSRRSYEQDEASVGRDKCFTS